MRAVVPDDANQVPTERKTGLNATVAPPRFVLIEDDWIAVLLAA
jgi:hypothetical protein